jgi:hypothetical protein
MRTLQGISFLILSATLFTGCIERSTTDPNKSYEYWLGEKLPKGVKAIHAQYWQSPHWSKEYIIYIELEAYPEWKAQLVKQNHLVLSRQKLEIPGDAPKWFKPIKDYKYWKNPQDTNCEYFEDSSTGHFFVYEEQL